MFEQTKHKMAQTKATGIRITKKGVVASAMLTCVLAFQNNTDIPSNGVHGIANTIDSGSQDSANFIVKHASKGLSSLGSIIKGEGNTLTQNNAPAPANENSHDPIGDFIRNGFNQNAEKQVGSFQNPINAQKFAKETGGRIEIANVDGKKFHRVYAPR